ncbi:hypothetical protein BGW42_003376 [Actinomortierella wolfii]|nr:hypothetical protein BGW42_003376 [Actinomortierella wolfii]
MLQSTISLLALFALLVQFVIALPQPLPVTPPETPTVPGVPDFNKVTLFDRRDVVPGDYKDLGAASLDLTVQVSIGLKISNLDKLEDLVLKASNIDDPNRPDFLPAEGLFALTDPPQAIVDLTLLWIKTVFGVEASYSHGTFSFSVRVEILNTVLQTTYHIYESPTGEQIIRTLSLSIPEVLVNEIGYFTPGTSFDGDLHGPPTVSQEMTKYVYYRKKRADCDTEMLPNCLQQLYGIPTAVATSTNNMIGVPGFVNEYANKNDLVEFMKIARPDLNRTPTFQESLINGGKNPQDPNTAGIEANLDIQYTVGVASGVPVIFISSGMATMQAFINLADHLLQMPSPPTVISISYGFDEDVVSPPEAQSFCNKMTELGARGVSVIVASGDGGVAGGRPSNQCKQFKVTFPASCPFVTSVGATRTMTETGAEFSAGGFSNKFMMPGYQAQAVNAYLNQLGDQHNGLYNRNGRGIPDVAATGENLAVIHNGKRISVDGTSASAPIFASIVALINDKLLAQGKKPLGFLNPYIYSKPGLFNDITTGSNPSCNSTGFSAKTGWDPVTGLGSPNFPRFAQSVGV